MLSRLNDVAQDVSHHLGKMAQGDFRETITHTYWGDFITMEQSIKAIHHSLKDTLSQISRSAGTVAGSAVQVSNGAQSLSQGATEQASAIHELSGLPTSSRRMQDRPQSQRRKLGILWPWQGNSWGSA